MKNDNALNKAVKQLTQLEELMSERSSLELGYRMQAKELDAKIVATRGALSMALTMAMGER